MFSTARNTSTLINDQLVTRTVYWTERKGGKSDSEQHTENMIAKRKAERKARGRVEREEEV